MDRESSLIKRSEVKSPTFLLHQNFDLPKCWVKNRMGTIIEQKAGEQYFVAVLLFIPYKVFLTFKLVDETHIKYNHSNEKCRGEHCCGSIYCTVQLKRFWLLVAWINPQLWLLTLRKSICFGCVVSSLV